MAAEPGPDNPLFGSCLCRGRPVRGDGAFSLGQSLPLLAVQGALGRVRRNSGPRRARRFPPACWGGVDPRLQAGRWTREGVLFRLRVQPVRRRVAGGRRSGDPPRFARRRPWNPAAISQLRRVTSALGGDRGRRSPALRREPHVSVSERRVRRHRQVSRVEPFRRPAWHGALSSNDGFGGRARV